MPTLTPAEASVLVFTFKEGLLSAVGHDLKLEVTDFAITVDPDDEHIEARFAPDSLRVVSAVKDGVDTPGVLSAKDIATIESYIVNDVLVVRKHPRITFESTEFFDNGDGTWDIEGRLTLFGATRTIQTTAALHDDVVVAEVTLHQPAWGIKPFSAMLGTLRIKPDVVVRVTVPASALGS